MLLGGGGGGVSREEGGEGSSSFEFSVRFKNTQPHDSLLSGGRRRGEGREIAGNSVCELWRGLTQVWLGKRWR